MKNELSLALQEDGLVQEGDKENFAFINECLINNKLLLLYTVIALTDKHWQKRSFTLFCNIAIGKKHLHLSLLKLLKKDTIADIVNSSKFCRFCRFQIKCDWLYIKKYSKIDINIYQLVTSLVDNFWVSLFGKLRVTSIYQLFTSLVDNFWVSLFGKL